MRVYDETGRCEFWVSKFEVFFKKFKFLLMSSRTFLSLSLFCEFSKSKFKKCFTMRTVHKALLKKIEAGLPADVVDSVDAVRSFLFIFRLFVDLSNSDKITGIQWMDSDASCCGNE